MSFEFDLKPVLTSPYYAMDAGSAHTIASRALRLAKKELKPSRWRSLVVVIQREDDVKPTRAVAPLETP